MVPTKMSDKSATAGATLQPTANTRLPCPTSLSRTRRIGMLGFLSVCSGVIPPYGKQHSIWQASGYRGADGVWCVVSESGTMIVADAVKYAAVCVAKLRKVLGNDALVVVVGESGRIDSEAGLEISEFVPTVLTQIESTITGNVHILRSGNRLGVITNRATLDEMATYDPTSCKSAFHDQNQNPFGHRFYVNTGIFPMHHLRLLMYHGNRYVDAATHAVLPQVLTAAHLRKLSSASGIMTRIGEACMQAAREGKTAFQLPVDEAARDEVVRRMTELGYKVSTEGEMWTFDAAPAAPDAPAAP